MQEFQDLRRKGIRLEIGGGDDDGDDGSWDDSDEQDYNDDDGDDNLTLRQWQLLVVVDLLHDNH